MSQRAKLQRIMELALSLISVLISNLASLYVLEKVFNKINDYPQDQWIMYFITLLGTTMVVSLLFSSSINLLRRNRTMELVSTLRNCSITYAGLILVLAIIKCKILDSRYLLVSSLILYIFISLVGRYFLKKFFLKRFSDSKFASIVGIVTTSDRAESFIDELKPDWSKNIKAVALIDAEYKNGVFRYPLPKKSENSKTRYKTVSEISGVPVIANKDNFMGWIRTASLDEVYLNFPLGTDINFSQVIEELEDMGIVVHINIPTFESFIKESKFDNFSCKYKAGYPMATFTPVEHNNFEIFLKRCMDFVGGLFGSIISIPIILITAIPLLIESPGKLFFVQQRVGKNGRIFNMYKLRSMYPDAEERKKELMNENKMDGFMFKMDNDPRITKVGKVIRKLSIDELPQFFNVLKGDMSLVGTRPPTVDEFEQYESRHKRRLSMKPGITGLWQVSGRSDIQNFEEVVKLDCEYIDNWSIFTDIKLLFKTVEVVLKGSGAE